MPKFDEAIITRSPKEVAELRAELVKLRETRDLLILKLDKEKPGTAKHRRLRSQLWVNAEGIQAILFELERE